MNAFDFGYSWYWRSAHVIPLAVFGGALALTWWRRRSIWIRVAFGVLTLWSLAGLLIVRYGMRTDLPLALPTERFLPSGSGIVLDAGCGSGRSTLMVAQSRPGARIVALDRFAAGYGIEGNRPGRLRRNLEVAGVVDQVEIREGDMRELPFTAESFDAVVSAYAIDHLGRGGFRTALHEIARVLRVGGQFLFFTVQRDIWMRTAYPFLHHGYYGPNPRREDWESQLTEGGAFEVVEAGSAVATMYFLCRKR
jgi:SAM-dependent methyltransferase